MYCWWPGGVLSSPHLPHLFSFLASVAAVLTSSPFRFIPPWLVEGTLAGGTLDGTSTAVFPGPVTSWNETAGLGDGNIFKYDGLFFLSLTLAKPTEQTFHILNVSYPNDTLHQKW